MKNGERGEVKGLKKPYRKPTVESRGLKLGVYGDYTGDIGNPGNNPPDDHRGHDHGHGGGHRGGHWF